MGDGRTVWWGKDAAWYGREGHTMIGERFGPEGIVVIDFLSCQAKAQNDGGRVRFGVRAVTRGCFMQDPARVEEIIRYAATIEVGVLDELVDEERTMTARISGWQRDQEHMRAASRQAAKRARDESEDFEVGVTDRDPPLQAVTVRDKPSPTGQDRTGQDSEQSSPSDKPPARQRRRSTPVDPATLPAGLNADLEALAPLLLDKINRLWEQRGGEEPTLRGVGLALRRFPDRDHARVVDDLEYWATVGKGRNRSVQDWPKTLATFLESTPAGAVSRPVQVPVRDSEYDRAVIGG